MNKSLDVHLVWIPAHRGILGNEKADDLAKSASNHGRHLKYSIPYTDLYQLAAESAYKRSTQAWFKASWSKGTHYFQHYYKESRQPWFIKLKAQRRDIVTISRIRSNHYGLASSLFRKNLLEYDECLFCGETEEDINHVMWSCPKYQVQRDELERCLIKNKFFPPHNTEYILHTPASKITFFIARFLRECELFVWFAKNNNN